VPDDPNKWNLSHATTLLQLKRRKYNGAIKTIQTARQSALVTLSTAAANIDSYHIRYGEITR